LGSLSSRYIFWIFLRERVTALLESAVKKNLDYQLLKAEVLDIQKNESIYKLIVADDFANKVEIESSKVILSIGSPLKKIYTLGNDESLSRVSLIEDLYQPKLEVNIKRICDSLKKSVGPE
jgi:uncharacterized NAD(P)/FAD-binding protein YdhS